MQRIIISKGIGFYLTPLALYEYYKLKGIDIFIYERRCDYRDREQEKDFFMYMQRLTLKQILKNNFKDRYGGFYTFKSDHGYKIVEENEEGDLFQTDDWLYESFSSLKSRMDKDLISVFEKLGDNSTFAGHKILEIEDGIELELHEGQCGSGDWVEEVHKHWS